MGIGLSLLGLGLGGAGLYPGTLFAAGEQGAWYDPSDFATMFQDSAGTTPVTAVEQPVGLILDKSGRGNHAIQATAASRPVLKQDASGNYYLNFDGVDDGLATGSIDFSATDKMTVWAGVHKASDAGMAILAELGVRGSVPGSLSITAPDGASASYGAYLDNVTVAQRGMTTFAAPVSNVLAVGFNLAAVTIATQITPRVNGATPTLTDAGAPTSSGNFGNLPLYIARRGSALLPFNGRLYSLIVRGAASSAAQIASAERYVGARSGVSL
jgi:hypothetical protein